MKKFKYDRKTKRYYIGAVLTITLALVATIVLLVVLTLTYQWTWEDVLFVINPFAKGNNWAWAVYVAIIAFIMFAVWLIHKGKMEEIEK